MMTPQQRWLLDTQGFLHLRAAVLGDELAAAQRAADSYISAHGGGDDLEQTAGGRPWPAGFGVQRTGPDLTVYAHGFAWDPALEALTRHPSIWPIVIELTDSRPRFVFGSLMQQHAEHTGLQLHAGSTPTNREDFRRLWHDEGGEIRCTDFVCFVYLTDVHHGDGGLVVCPGSHHASTPMPAELAALPIGEGGDVGGSTEQTLYSMYALQHISPAAGDVVVMPEHLLHGNAPWRPRDRDRRLLALRYNVQHMGVEHGFPDEIVARLQPETKELASLAPYGTVKEVVAARM